MRYLSGIWMTIGLLLNQAQLNAAECITQSTSQTIPLLELYTSEGCSSCPPAELWLSSLKEDTAKVIPLAFHVDYWDYIGWKDHYAKPEFSARQRKSAALGGASFVYTPQLILNGKDFRGVNTVRFEQALDSIHAQTARAQLRLQAQTINGEIVLHASAQTLTPAEAKNAQVFIALYQNQLSSQVTAGENNGRTLKHDFVVRELWRGYHLQTNFSKNITLANAWQKEDAGVVLFVQDMKSGEVWQSLQLSLKNCN